MKSIYVKMLLPVLLLTLVVCGRGLAADNPEKTVSPPADSQPQDTASPSDNPATSGEVPDDEKPATPCQNACMELAKPCHEQCKTLDSDDNQMACKKTCQDIFTLESGYCFSRCQHNDKFLTPCPQNEENEAPRSSDDCIDGCEDHYGACVMGCRDKFKGKDNKLKVCYENCTDVFAENEGFCKSQCELEPGFMHVCTP